MWDELADTYGDKTALIFEDKAGNTREFSYSGFNREINRAANFFHALGIRKEDKVAVQMHNCPEFLLCWFGLAKIGAVMVPVNVHYLDSECAYILKKCDVKHVVIEREFLEVYSSLRHEKDLTIETIVVARERECVELDGAVNMTLGLGEQSETLDHVEPLTGDDVAEILFTSGTTSRPKGVVITHYNLVFAGMYTSWQCALRQDDRYLTMMPAFHIDFQCTAALPTFASGATFILLEKYSAHKFWNQICCYRATITECIPFMVRTLMLQPVKPWEKNHCLREVFFYLSLAKQEKDAFVERFNVRFLTSYGMTETIVGIVGDVPGKERRWPSIGKPGFGYEVKIMDEKGAELAPGNVGEICIKGVPGKTLLREYYNAPEATAKLLNADGWLRTGDNGYMDEDGYFYFVDRNLNMIKRSGENISGIEIENILVCHPKIMEAAVVGVPDTIHDEIVKAFVVVKAGETLSAEEVYDYCSAHIAKFKVPGSIEFTDSLPRSCAGKVQKHLLRQKSIAEGCTLVPGERCVAAH